MITRLAALIALAYAVGFIVFAFTLGKPAPADAAATDAAVVLTGGSGRLEHAVDVLRANMRSSDNVVPWWWPGPIHR